MGIVALLISVLGLVSLADLLLTGVEQYLENTGKNNLKFLCIVDPAWKKEDEAILNFEFWIV